MAPKTDDTRAAYLQAALTTAFELGRAIALQPAPEFADAADCAAAAALADRLALQLGAVRIEVTKDETRRDVRVDAYPASVLSEVFGAVTRFFHAASRAQIYVDVADALRNTPALVENAGEARDLATDVVTTEAWDLVEVAYFRAAASWDRIGQLLDFVFFNVREYREGFAATMKKLKVNFDVDNLPGRPLRDSPDWLVLRRFETHGHGTLTSKRNLVAHRLSARPTTEPMAAEDAAARVVPYSDHLRLASGPFELLDEELAYLRAHLFTVRDGIAAAISLSLWWLTEGRGQLGTA